MKETKKDKEEQLLFDTFKQVVSSRETYLKNLELLQKLTQQEENRKWKIKKS